MAKKKDSENKHKDALERIHAELLRLSTSAQSPAHRDAFACATEITSRELQDEKSLSNYSQFNIKT